MHVTVNPNLKGTESVGYNLLVKWSWNFLKARTVVITIARIHNTAINHH